MKTDKFYQTLNTELEQIIADGSNRFIMEKLKEEAHKKGYALLIWFLKFYGQKPHNQEFITDGSGDYACDLIFSNNDPGRDEVYYVVQSKWAVATNAAKPIAKEEFNAALTDFNTILKRVPLNNKNEKFQKQYKKLIEHLNKNGKAKFVFFTLGSHNPEIDAAIVAFNKDNYPNIDLEVIDINRLKRDYIELKYKDIIADNPLDPQYELEEMEISIEIAAANRKTNQETRNIFVFDGSDDAYTFAVKPKTIYDLFKRYKYNLFFKNVRNPLPESGYNQLIVQTLLNRPAKFWYFNNGITAITNFIPDIGKDAQHITIKGLQIINGAQTVHAIYQAYESASKGKRQIMDNDARINLRLMRSSDDEFNLEITRFTNSQNAMEDRDFVSNETEQKRLQEESFNTNYWYEKRRGEFVPQKPTSPNNLNKTKIVANQWFALAYMAFYLQKPTDAYLYHQKLFVKAQYDKDGQYEKIFTPQTSFTNLLAAYLVWEQIEEKTMVNIDSTAPLELELTNLKLATLALTRVVLEKYIPQKYPQNNTNKPPKTPDVCEFVVKAFEQEIDKDKLIIAKTIAYAAKYINKKIEGKDDQKTRQNFEKLLTHSTYYEIIKEEVEEADLPVSAIDALNNFVLTDKN
ncbi:MAG: AIPR family protein [Sphingobacteriales bacterium]|nr:AIPR family protein [Sphingobacteriales bacterium]